MSAKDCADYSGFVLAFDVFDKWFWDDDNYENPKPLPVSYDDVVVGELMDLIDLKIVPFLRKRSGWAYEKEWRMFTFLKERAKFVAEHDVSLFEVPATAFLGVLIGHKTPSEVSSRIILPKVLHMPPCH